MLDCADLGGGEKGGREVGSVDFNQQTKPMKTIEQRVIAAAQKHGWSVNKVRKNLNNPPSGDEVRAILEACEAREANVVFPEYNPAKSDRKTLAGFRDAHDYAKRIKEAIAEHCHGDSYLTEAELRQSADVPGNLWRRYADLPEFESNKLTYRGQVLWGSQSTIKQMRDIIKGL